MDGSSATLPILYSDDLEKPGEDEQQVIAELVETMLMRARRPACEMSTRFRREHSGCPVRG